MAGVFGAGDGRFVKEHPIDQLHHIFIDMGLFDFTVLADDMGQGGVGIFVLIFQLPARVVNGRIVEPTVADHPFGPHDHGIPGVGQATSRRPIDKAKEAVAKVEHHKGVVIHVGGQGFAAELSLVDAHTGHGRNPLGRAQNASEGVQAIDRHIIEGATTRAAEIPGRIDIREGIIAAAHTLILVIIAKGRAGRRPGQPA